MERIVSEEELKDFAIRMRKLSDKKIDETWYRCGYIIVDHEKHFKALRQLDIDAIRESLDSAMNKISNLTAETPLEIVRKNLADVEKEI